MKPLWPNYQVGKADEKAVLNAAEVDEDKRGKKYNTLFGPRYVDGITESGVAIEVKLGPNVSNYESMKLQDLRKPALL